MEDRLNRIYQRFLELLKEELDALLKDAVRPERLMSFIRSMGFDPSKLPGMLGQQPGFDPYQVLGLDKSASDEEVRKRYRELIFKLHPDQSGTPGTNFLFRMVLAAYEMIKLQRGW